VAQLTAQGEIAVRPEVFRRKQLDDPAMIGKHEVGEAGAVGAHNDVRAAENSDLFAK